MDVHGISKKIASKEESDSRSAQFTSFHIRRRDRVYLLGLFCVFGSENISKKMQKCYKKGIDIIGRYLYNKDKKRRYTEGEVIR